MDRFPKARGPSSVILTGKVIYNAPLFAKQLLVPAPLSIWTLYKTRPRQRLPRHTNRCANLGVQPGLRSFISLSFNDSESGQKLKIQDRMGITRHLPENFRFCRKRFQGGVPGKGTLDSWHNCSLLYEKPWGVRLLLVLKPTKWEGVEVRGWREPAMELPQRARGKTNSPKWALSSGFLTAWSSRLETFWGAPACPWSSRLGGVRSVSPGGVLSSGKRSPVSIGSSFLSQMRLWEQGTPRWPGQASLSLFCLQRRAWQRPAASL